MNHDSSNPYAQTQSYEMDSYDNNAHGQDFNDLLNDMDNNLAQYSQLIRTLEQQESALVNEINGERENQLTQETNRLQAQIQSLQATIQPQLQQILNQSQKDAGKAGQAEYYKQKFAQLIKQYRTVQLDYKEKQKGEAARMYRTINPAATDEEVRDVVEDYSGKQIFAQAALQSNRRGEAQTALNEVLQRNRDVAKLEKSLQELLQLFTQVEDMVAEQDVQVQEVYQNVKVAHVDVEKGTKQTEQGAVYAKKAWKKKWWLFGVIALIIIIIVVVVLCTKLINKS
ncbi:hypothetical protein BABINDRAFT_36836 [Babjeviella inositovora NRRL Y-12698]|uniref:t-SNARE coiled-coil homology domain-containing protein n=1 Tax=Babjeviella inositovora NRRL Y-12698 TaxID=984486 RepID=A0A1E3QSL8_9ASCO|nr:uncharacterized protein BABINDRAFT_36836 [Babjeviella inositovora NRRL Y-12698]ODQ80012.1 hypothetical protein BABINDRAFT_36836 [Babjeviella inositovora NRRL Y-12698]